VSDNPSLSSRRSQQRVRILGPGLFLRVKLAYNNNWQPTLAVGLRHFPTARRAPGIHLVRQLPAPAAPDAKAELIGAGATVEDDPCHAH
jgi:hypothetical protein